MNNSDRHLRYIPLLISIFNILIDSRFLYVPAITLLSVSPTCLFAFQTATPRCKKKMLT